jgi:hypothetical protein
MRWPVLWRSPSLLELLKNSGIDCVIDNRPEIAEAASQAGVKVFARNERPNGVVEIEGLWPGIRTSRFGAADTTGSGPTGEPWINTNTWLIRLAAARNPGKALWCRTSAGGAGISAQPYVLSIADAALAGGRWVIALEDELAAGIANADPACLEVWRRIAAASRFFADNRSWSGYTPEAALGVFSTFSHSSEQEVLNLIARSGQQYRVLLRGAASPDLAGLRAVLFPDKEPPSAPDRATLRAFVSEGGLLIAGPEWGTVSGAARQPRDHPRFSLYTLGKGTVAVAKNPLADPYLLANDCTILMSHRFDLLRFWNGGALQACRSSMDANSLVQVLFYATQPPVDSSLWVAGNFSEARLRTFDAPDPRSLKIESRRDGIEIQLPGAMRYAAIELSRS